MTPRGRFVTLEGAEGAGKSTSLDHARAIMAAAGLEVDVTREPGGTPGAEAIRRILLGRGEEPMSDVAELLLMFAGRSLHLENRIRPSLDAGRWVLCDRFTDATWAYQGGGRGLPQEWIGALETWVQDGLQPDLTLLLDVDPAVGLARIAGRGDRDRFEVEQLAFFERVRGVYLDRAARDPGRFRVIDASQPADAVRLEITKHLNKFIQSID
jgi:dTMP kinase